MSVVVRQPPLELLHTLLLFAEHKESAAVARALDLDPAQVSRRLRELREDYGLLSGRGQTQKLTRKGEEALPAIRVLLRDYDHLAAWLAGRQGRPQVLSLGTGSRVAQLHVPRAVMLFAAGHPGWQVQVQVRRGRERILGTFDGALNLAVVSHDAGQIQTLLTAQRGEGARLEVTELARECLCVIARQGSPAGERLAGILESQEVPLSWLAEFDLAGLDGESGLRRQLERRLGRRPLRFRVEGGGWATAREFARRGLGAAVVPLSLLGPGDRTDLAIRRLGREACLTDRLVYRPGDGGVEHEALRQAVGRAARDQQREVRERWGGFLPL